MNVFDSVQTASIVNERGALQHEDIMGVDTAPMLRDGRGI